MDQLVGPLLVCPLCEFLIASNNPFGTLASLIFTSAASRWANARSLPSDRIHVQPSPLLREPQTTAKVCLTVRSTRQCRQ